MKLIAVTLIVFGIQAQAADMKLIGLSDSKERAFFCQSEPKGFFGFRKAGDKVSMVAVQFAKSPMDPVMDAPLDLDPEAARPKTCWLIKTEIDYPVLVSGFAARQNLAVFPELSGLIGSPAKEVRTSKGQSYDVSFPAFDPPGENAKDKTLTIKKTDYSCALGKAPGFDDVTGFRVLLAVDLNEDNQPDFFVENSWKSSFSHYELMLSNAGKKMCEPKAEYSQYGC